MAQVDHLWYGGGAGAMAARVALWPFGLVYDLAMSARTRLYDAGVLHAEVAALPTVSVGNLTVGGTGKTPFAAWVASELSKQARPGIVLRGYGGDEADVHRRLNPTVPVVVNVDRAAAIREARAQGADVAVLDDAFQHRRIARTADIVLLSAEQLSRPRRPLPAGPWREPLSAARRADLVVITRKSATLPETREAMALVRDAVPDVPTAMVHLAPSALVSANDDATLRIEQLRGTSVLVIAAIGEPRIFARQIEALGARVALAAFRDHYAYSDAEIAELAARVPQDGLAVCTLKDAVKLAGKWPGPSRLWYVSQQLVVEQGAENVRRLLKRVLDARATATTTAG